MAYIKRIFVLLVIMGLTCGQAPAEGERIEDLEQLLAESYMAGGEYEKAIESYRKIIKEEPDNIKARIILADMLSWIREYDESIAEYKKVLEMRPGDLQVRKKLAQVYSWKKDYGNAENLYKEIIEEDPQDTEACISLGEILTWQRRYPEAIRYFTKAMEGAGTGEAKVLYGRALLYSGQYDLAETVFTEVLESQPDNFQVKVYLADTYAYSKRFDKAIELYRETLRQKQDLAVKEKLADVLSWDRKYRESIDIYDEMLREKYDIKIDRQKARVLGWSRQYGRALEEYRRILMIKDDGLVRLEMEAKKAYWSGRIKTAIDDYTLLIKKDPENVEAMFDLAQIYSYQSMWKEAIGEYDRILEMIPTHFRAEEGLRKAELMAKHVLLKTGYRFFEADSSSRETDIRKHQFLSDLSIPVGYKARIEAGYTLTGRMFSDFHDILENEGMFKVSYLNNPDWQAGAYYGIIGYNRDIDEYMHLFGGNASHRVLDMGMVSFNYDRQRLENTSEVIREYYYRNDFKARLDIDATIRLKLGTDYLYSYYSDDNSKNEPAFDILYYLSLDPKRFTIKYRYFYREFKDKVGEYFSPKGFSTSAFSFDWRHYLNKEEIFFGADDIYYGLNYDITVDSTDIVGHKFSWEFNWDLNKRLNFNVRGSVTGSSVNVYRESGVAASVKYYF